MHRRAPLIPVTLNVALNLTLAVGLTAALAITAAVPTARVQTGPTSTVTPDDASERAVDLR